MRQDSVRTRVDIPPLFIGSLKSKRRHRFLLGRDLRSVGRDIAENHDYGSHKRADRRGRTDGYDQLQLQQSDKFATQYEPSWSVPYDRELHAVGAEYLHGQPAVVRLHTGGERVVVSRLIHCSFHSGNVSVHCHWHRYRREWKYVITGELYRGRANEPADPERWTSRAGRRWRVHYLFHWRSGLRSCERRRRRCDRSTPEQHDLCERIG